MATQASPTADDAGAPQTPRGAGSGSATAAGSAGDTGSGTARGRGEQKKHRAQPPRPPHASAGEPRSFRPKFLNRMVKNVRSLTLVFPPLTAVIFCCMHSRSTVVSVTVAQFYLSCRWLAAVPSRLYH